MKILRHGFIFLIIVYMFLAAMIACTTSHSIIFQNEACIKPFKRYDYHTCDKMFVTIDGETYVVPKDFKTDLASVPRVLWPFLAPQYSGFVAPAILHDYLYGCGSIVTRQWADEVFYSALVGEGVTRYTAMKFYVAVRLFGARHFNEHEYKCTRIVDGTSDKPGKI